MDRDNAARTARRRELAAFLRAQRSRLQPGDVGLPIPVGNRRTPGLRREEVAQLSGVGITWYTWLEQGRSISASPQVVDALSRAFQLDAAQHRHLRSLAGLPPPERERSRDEVTPRLQRLVDAAAPNAATILDEHFDFLVWNTAYVRVRHDPARLPDGQRNLLWMLFVHPESRTTMVRWEPAARAVLSQFRAAVGQRAGDPRFTELVAALTETSPEFRDWWQDYPIRDFQPATISIEHREAGRIALEIFQLRLVEYPELILVVQVPASDDDKYRVQTLLDASNG